MNNHRKIFYGTKDDWLSHMEYAVQDVFDDGFALNFQRVSTQELIDRGENFEEPEMYLVHDGIFEWKLWHEP